MTAAASRRVARGPGLGPFLGEARWGLELAALVADAGLRPPRRQPGAPPVLLIPGFMAGDASLLVLRSWLRLRGHPVAMSGIRLNVDCAERAMGRLTQTAARVRVDDVGACGRDRPKPRRHARAVSRRPRTRARCGVRDARVAGPRSARSVISGAAGRAVRRVAGRPRRARHVLAQLRRRRLLRRLPPRLGGNAPGDRQGDGDLFAQRRDRRLDGVLDPDAEMVEVDSSHCGMAVNAGVYRVLENALAPI